MNSFDHKPLGDSFYVLMVLDPIQNTPTVLLWGGLDNLRTAADEHVSKNPSSKAYILEVFSVITALSSLHEVFSATGAEVKRGAK